MKRVLKKRDVLYITSSQHFSIIQIIDENIDLFLDMLHIINLKCVADCIYCILISSFSDVDFFYDQIRSLIL